MAARKRSKTKTGKTIGARPSPAGENRKRGAANTATKKHSKVRVSGVKARTVAALRSAGRAAPKSASVIADAKSSKKSPRRGASIGSKSVKKDVVKLSKGLRDTTGGSSASRNQPASVVLENVPRAVKVSSASISPKEPKGSPGTSAKPLPSGEQLKAPDQEELSLNPKPARPSGQRHGFRLNEFVVYPAHGVGQIVAVEEQEVAGFTLELYVINFPKDKMTLRVPTSKVVGVGMRKISDPDVARRSLDILTGRARVKRTMWSRRAQEYESKINSGDIIAIAEVVRDLYRSDAQPEQSYSERQLYEAALDRMVREIAAVNKSNELDALMSVEAHLQKSQSRSTKGLPQSGPADLAVERAA